MENLQVSTLATSLRDDIGPFIKPHTVQRKLYYELLPAGLELAKRLKNRQFPESPGHYRCSKKNHLEGMDPRYSNICLGVDLLEGGGGTKTLHRMCEKLFMIGCPYIVGSLAIGDYEFFLPVKVRH